MIRKIRKQRVIIQAHDTGLTLHKVIRSVTLMEENEIMGGYVSINGSIYSVEKKAEDTAWYNCRY